MRIQNPATLSVLAEVEEDGPESIAEKLTRARRAQPAWAALPLNERLAAMVRFRALVIEEREALARVLTREVGKPITQARNELGALPARIDFFLENTEEVLRPERVYQQKEGGQSVQEELITQEPLGVIANVSAWNYPWFVGSNVFLPALLTGNAVLYKPSEHATLTGLEITRLLHQAGVPTEIFVSVIGGASAGRALIERPLDGVFFTGSYRTGRAIAEAVAPRLIRVGLELGGKDPSYVTEDADVQAAALSLADGAMYNAGQSCCAVERIYVHQAVIEPFLETFLEAIRGLRLGDPEDPETSIGPLARSEQIAILKAQVEDALSLGARLVLGGNPVDRKGNYFEPTVLTDVNHQMRVMREESFGPIIGIAVVDGDQQAIALMNDTEYGLTAGIYTRDRARAESVLGRLDTGSVYWNCCDRVSPRLPWTGRRHSGIGSTLSTHGIRSFLQPKAWHLRR